MSFDYDPFEGDELLGRYSRYNGPAPSKQAQRRMRRDASTDLDAVLAELRAVADDALRAMGFSDFADPLRAHAHERGPLRNGPIGSSEQPV